MPEKEKEKQYSLDTCGNAFFSNNCGERRKIRENIRYLMPKRLTEDLKTVLACDEKQSFPVSVCSPAAKQTQGAICGDMFKNGWKGGMVTKNPRLRSCGFFSGYFRQ